MDPFVGSTGLKNINREIIQEYYSFLRGIDHLDILPNYFEADGQLKTRANRLLVTDLGSIIDINIISAFLDPLAEQYKIVEVGGGYGRLAEAFLSLYGKNNINYVLLDAVPASLMYSYLYLSRNFPDRQIGFYYNDDPFNMDSYDCYILPAWHFDASLCKGRVDCCINIQSMQEMDQHHVDHYFALFDEVLKPESGIVYISNEKDYIFQGAWNYPADWKLLLKTRTPRSWTRNSPTEVFRKRAGSAEKENRLVDFVYSLQLNEFDRNADQRKTISDLQVELQNSRDEMSALQGQLQASREEISGLQTALQKGQEQIAGLQVEVQRRGEEIAGLQLALQKDREEISSLQTALQKDRAEIAGLQLALENRRAELSHAQFKLQNSRQEVANLSSTLSRMPITSDEPTIERTEKTIQSLMQYYHSQELPDVIRLFENTSKINARLVALNIALRHRRYKRALVHLARIGLMDPLMLFSLQTLKAIGNGLLFRLS
jgi:predicted  nucleic acid-binding Zn-ribbon protein